MSMRPWRGTPWLSQLSSAAARPLTACRPFTTKNTCAREEVTPAEYAERRARFLACLPPHSVALLPAADECIFSHDILCPHRQDSLWGHLFGIHTPLRRTLEPPTSTLTDEVRATMAVLGRSSNHSTHTLLCVPPVTTDPETLVWASERRPHDSLSLACGLASASEDGVLSTAAVVDNDVGGILDAVCGLITRMTVQKLGGGVTETAMEEHLSRDRRALLNVVPQLFAAYPQQLRWDGRRYRLPPSILERGQHSKPAPTFHHPLEAFFATLNATAFTVQLPCLLRVAGIAGGQPPWSTVTFRYKTGSGYTPGLVKAPAETTETANAAVPPAREVVIAALSASSTSPRTSPPLTSATASGEVCQPIHRLDRHAWSYRRVKGPSQVRQHLRSARATEHAFVQLLRSAATTASEHDLHCSFQRSVCDASAHFGPAARVCSAYIPVIASGVRGTEIHYTDNSAEASAGQLVRVDAGVEVEGVPTDCTRTFRVKSCTFEPVRVAQLYGGLLQLQRKLLRRIAPGVAVAEIARLHLDETQALLCALGVDMRTVTTTSGSEARQAGTEVEERERQLPMALVRSCFCAHSFGHLFGIDIHEEWGSATATAAPRIFEGGVMHTVEPGIYLPSVEHASRFGISAVHHLPVDFHGGVGVQLEDDVLVLPPADGTTALGCTWSRGAYLQHALAAFARHYGGAVTNPHHQGSRNPTSLRSPSFAVCMCHEHLQAQRGNGDGAVLPHLAAHEANVVCFLFAQRLAIDGEMAAASALLTDVAAVHRLSYTASPAYGADGRDAVLVPDAADTAWYPYAVVVLTATVPKDVRCIEAVMQQSRRDPDVPSGGWLP